MDKINWENDNILYIANEVPKDSDEPDEKILRSVIEPWLTAVFQSEHLSLLLGNGFTRAVSISAGVTQIPGMEKVSFGTKYDEQIDEYAKKIKLNVKKYTFEPVGEVVEVVI